MPLADSQPKRLTMLCAMYLAQGIPWGFMTIALISYLAQHGVSDAAAGGLTLGAIALIFACKIVTVMRNFSLG